MSRIFHSYGPYAGKIEGRRNGVLISTEDGNAVAYGNFFDMPERGEYRIEINIYESQKSGNESVRFEYEKY